MSHVTGNVVSLLPIRLDLLVVRGTSAPLRVTLQHPGTGDPYDITLDTVKMTVRDGYAGMALLTKTNAPGQHEDPEQGVTILDLTKTDLADAANVGIVKDYWYEIRRIEPSGVEIVFFEGLFRLKPTPRPV